MKRRFKLATTIVAMLMTVTLTLFGVFAATGGSVSTTVSFTFTKDENISFTVDIESSIADELGNSSLSYLQEWNAGTVLGPIDTRTPGWLTDDAFGTFSISARNYADGTVSQDNTITFTVTITNIDQLNTMKVTGVPNPAMTTPDQTNDFEVSYTVSGSNYTEGDVAVILDQSDTLIITYTLTITNMTSETFSSNFLISLGFEYYEA